MSYDVLQRRIDEIINRFRSGGGDDDGSEPNAAPQWNILTIIEPSVEVVLQKGPQCGIVALVMALRFKNIQIEVAELYDKAKKNGFTRQGELFDIFYLYKLVSMFYVNSEIIEYNRLDLRKGCFELMKHLREKRLVLIAYDSDFNFEPCFKRGTKAHWCLLSGFMCPEEDEPELDKLYVIATHGKSSHRAFWSLKKLIASNLQLKEVGELRSNADQYVLPENGSISETLSGKFLVIY